MAGHRRGRLGDLRAAGELHPRHRSGAYHRGDRDQSVGVVSTIERLRAAQLDERLAAVAELAARDEVDAGELQALRDCLGGDLKVLQRRAAEAFAALHQRGAAVTEVLRAGLRADNRQLRWGAAYALSRIGAAPAAALPVLLECLGAN